MLPPVVQMHGVVRRFGSTEALAGVDFELAGGEIHALLGENGAGKSTLVHVLFGLVRPDAGRFSLFGRPVAFPSPREAMAHGLGMVHQHFMLAPGLSVAENLVLGAGGGSGLRLPEARARLAELCRAHRFEPLDPDRDVDELSVGQQQRLEILKALHREARILILDEPTAVLAPQEVDDLFTALDRLRQAGRSLIFISHKLEEITRLCDRVTVLRQGRNVATLPVGETTPARLSELMVGRGLPPLPVRAPRAEGAPVLQLRELGVKGRGGRPALDRLSLTVHTGEIFGVAGVDGNGQAELEDILAGVRSPDVGDLLFSGVSFRGRDAQARHRAGWAQISSNRTSTGLATALSVEENFALRAHRLPPFSRYGCLAPSGLRNAARAALDAYRIACPGPRAPASALSGGNQQKLVIARELDGNPRLIVACSPTRGLDVAATRFVHETLLARRAAGAAVLLISTELDEVLALADRMGVLVGGRLKEVPPAGRSRQAIGRMMLGESP